MKKVCIAIVLGLFCASNAKAGLIWEDGFESGNFSAWASADGNWATSGGSVHSGSKRAQVDGANNANGDILALSKSTANYSNIELGFYYRIYAGLENTDYLFVEWTANGSDWQSITTYTNVASSADWQEECFSLPAPTGNNPLFGFRLRAKFNGSSDCVYFDDFKLSGNPLPEPSSLLIFISGCFSLLVFLRPK